MGTFCTLKINIYSHNLVQSFMPIPIKNLQHPPKLHGGYGYIKHLQNVYELTAKILINGLWRTNDHDIAYNLIISLSE